MIDSKTRNAFRFFKSVTEFCVQHFATCEKVIVLQRLFNFTAGIYSTFFERWCLNRDISQLYPPRFRVVQSRLQPQRAPRMHSWSLYLKNTANQKLCALSAPTARIIALTGHIGRKGRLFFLSLYFHPSFIPPYSFRKKKRMIIISIIILSFIITSIICVGFSYVGFSNIGKSNLGSCVFCL